MDKKAISTTVIGAVITGIFGVVATLVGIYLRDSLDQRKTVTPAPSPQVQTVVPSQGVEFLATQPIIINGQAYLLPTGHEPRCAASGITDDTKNGVRYKLTIPDGWFIVWDSREASWPDGSYDNNGLLSIYGPWEGTVTIVYGEYYAVPVEWSQYAVVKLRGSSIPQEDRPEFYVNKP